MSMMFKRFFFAARKLKLKIQLPDPMGHSNELVKIEMFVEMIGNP
jgi:hypothetical protein